MRIVLDVSIAADNRIEGTASWSDRTGPIPFTGWLALMRLFEDAQSRRVDAADAIVGRFDRPEADP